jgi:CDP-diacylglycerol---serine O-phosphatidyltransferase
MSEPDSMEELSRPPRRGVYLFPNLITTGALFAGFLAVVAAMDGNFVTAAVAIYVAMVLDGLDGRVARMTSTESEFGKQYDSLADMVSFGLAPSLVFYVWGAKRSSRNWAGCGASSAGWLHFSTRSPPRCSLARYNSRLVSARATSDISRGCRARRRRRWWPE